MKMLLPKNKLTKVDLGIYTAIFLILVAASLLLAPPKTPREIQIITAEGETTVSLETDGTYDFSSNGYSYTLEVSSSSARLTHATCPDKTCMHMAPIGERSGALVCVPGELVIRSIEEGGVSDGADIVIP